jgi:predicted Ser/Thr protein kinase
LLKQGAAPDTGTQPAMKPFEAPTIAEIARLFPQLEVMGLLGKGGMGAVYKARQPGLDRLVALKILPAEGNADSGFADRFTREARALARLNHPNIISVYEFGRVDGLHFFIMEFVDGVNLRQLQKNARLSPREALQIVPQICDALQYAHDEGVVHRDIKPENVLIDRKGRVKIADFGLAKILGREAQDLRLTGEGQVMGTPNYMAPEQVEHPLDVDHRADIFSLGVVFYEMLTGELPLGKFPPPSRKVKVDVRLDEVVLHALEKEPERRYQQANEVKTAVCNITSTPGAAVPQRQPLQGSVPAWASGVEYKSKKSLWGLPLIHIATGMDPVTGKKRIATGIIAIGDIARGIIAIGGVSFGCIAFGGCAFGALAIGGLGIGLLACSGLGIGLIAAFAGGAVAPIAMGGGALGYWAYGGAAYGVHAVSALGVDPKGWDFFEPWVGPAMTAGYRGILIGSAFIAILAAAVPAWLLHHKRRVLGKFGFYGLLALAFLAAGLCLAPLLVTPSPFKMPRLYLFTGRVLDSRTGNPLPNATLTLLESESARRAISYAQADRDGYFSFMARSAGHILKTESPGHENNVLTIDAGTFDRKRHASLDLQLSPAWSPTPEIGQKPDLNKIREEANNFRNKGQYPEALDRYLWYWNHSNEYEPGSSAVRNSFLLADWVELSRRYPPAKQALLDIRARDTQAFIEGKGYFDLFMEVSALNRELQDEQATYDLFNKIRQQDPALARQCFFAVEPLLVKRGDYSVCLEYIGDPETAFSSIRQKREMMKQSEDRMDEIFKRVGSQAKGYHPPTPPKMADNTFVGDGRQLIRILVKTGKKEQAQHICEEALAVLDDPRIRTAITDVEHEPQ